MTRWLTRFLACRRLARMVEQNKRSFEVQDYQRRRKAALKYYRRG